MAHLLRRRDRGITSAGKDAQKSHCEKRIKLLAFELTAESISIYYLEKI